MAVAFTSFAHAFTPLTVNTTEENVRLKLRVKVLAGSPTGESPHPETFTCQGERELASKLASYRSINSPGQNLPLMVSGQMALQAPSSAISLAVMHLHRLPAVVLLITYFFCWFDVFQK